MAEIYQYEANTELKNNVIGIHNNWKELYTESGNGKKGFLTQMKKHYARIIEADPEAAAELLAMHEHTNSMIRKHGFPASEAK